MSDRIKPISDWLKTYNQKYDIRYVVMYHAAKKDAPILEKGLLAGRNGRKNFGMSESGYVYLAASPGMAKMFGSMAFNDNFTIYEVIVPISKLLPDKKRLQFTATEGASGNKLAQSVVYAGSARVKGDIERWQVKPYENEKERDIINEHDIAAKTDTPAHQSPDKPNIPKWAENARLEGFHFSPAKHLPDGWGWKDWDDGSGGLYSPENKCVAEYDYATREYKVDGEWSFMDDNGLDVGFIERLVGEKYGLTIAQANNEQDLEAAQQNNEQLNNNNEKERGNMSKHDERPKYDISARVNPLADQSGKVKAMASVTIDNVIAINSLTIVESNKNLFVGYPQTKDADGNFRDIVQFLREKSGNMKQASVELKDAISKLLLNMYKNGERATPEQEGEIKEPVMHEVKAFVTPLRDSESATKGLATVQIGDLFKINSVRVNENTKEDSENFGKNFVSMPSRPDETAEGGYRDIVHAVNKDFYYKISSAVLMQYDNQMEWKNHAKVKEQAAPQHEKPTANKAAHDIG